MHIVVCAKQVPDTSEVRIDPETNTLIREGVPSIMNPYDAHAVEAAMVLKDKYGGSVTVISMGPPQSEEVLRKAISFGADRAVLVSDRAFGGSDTLATSYILSQAIKKLDQEEQVDLVICGKQAIDGDTAQVGPGIATRLEMPQLTYVMEIIDANPEEKKIKVARKLEGSKEILEAPLPALLTVVKDINDLRYASLPNMIKAARFDKAAVWGKNDFDDMDSEQLGLKGSPTAVRRIFPPPDRDEGEIIPGGMEEPEKAAAALVEKLVKQEIIADW
ncbi:electron transfer flavoprotein subunit beta/FixA family protein [Metallumcola ferriviriculae]|uniref:Electron transfer flavoprotein small subunit n=1 Tax=Metallumcola ferriviriculae TaxID=3039180 RepID=A0AAU0UJM1_9FIRM|nr:electron transfer flavoprotein subunit beta/FixA family protein [Desulfitibacteraceae bacterium MK1]